MKHTGSRWTEMRRALLGDRTEREKRLQDVGLEKEYNQLLDVQRLNPKNVLFILLELVRLVWTAGPVCYSCKGIPHPRDCGRIVQCGDSEKCFVESIVTASGGLFFNSGCSANFRCGGPGKRDIMSPSSMMPSRNITVVEQADDIQVCYQCCDNTDYCNQNICDGSAPPKTNGTFCLNCPDVLKPSDCEYVTQCGDDDVCYTERIFINGELRYRLGCINKNNCVEPLPAMVGKKRFLLEPDLQLQDYCAKCCLSSLGNCNRDLCSPTGATLQTGARELILVTPPARTDYCEDLTPQSCKLLGLQNNKFCLSQSVKNYACREFCGTCVNSGHLTPAPTGPSATAAPVPTGSSVNNKDCFFSSKKYRGQVRHSSSGKPCQMWSVKLQADPVLASNLPDKSLTDASNFCRDPDGKGHPWCFVSVLTDDKGWEFCDVKYCAECYYSGKSAAYNGYVETTGPHQHCQPWNSFRLQPTPLRDSMFPGGSVALAGSYCRDPFRTNHPVCYLNDTLTNCNLPMCQGTCEDDTNTNCPALASLICKDEYYRTILCPKTCNMCGFGLLPPVHKDPPKDICSDNPDANCAVLKLLICTDPVSARQFCPRTCNACGFLTQPLTVSTGQTYSTQPVTTAATPQTTGPTTPPIPVWSSWGYWQCMTIKSGACVMLRYRQCSSGNKTDCPGKHYNLLPCNKTTCPVFFTTITTPTVPTVAVTTEIMVASTTAARATTTAARADCVDSPGCSNPDLGSIVCNDRDLAIHICPKKCNLCDECRDATGLNCSLPSIQSLFCPDKTMSVQYCQKTCGKCAERPIPITRNKCGDPVASESICSFLDQEICLCSDDDLRPFLCKNYCAGLCGPLAAVNCTKTYK